MLIPRRAAKGVNFLFQFFNSLLILSERPLLLISSGHVAQSADEDADKDRANQGQEERDLLLEPGCREKGTEPESDGDHRLILNYKEDDKQNNDHQ